MIGIHLFRCLEKIFYGFGLSGLGSGLSGGGGSGSGMSFFGIQAEGTRTVLLFDVSASVDAREYALQRDGIVAAFRDPQVLDIIVPY